VVELFTVGHSTRSLEEFVRLLAWYRVELVADVRRFPTSSKYPHFSKETLSRELEARGIGYVWLGNLLGGYRRGGYRAYMETKGFACGVEKLLQLASRRKTALMCSERLWFKCHRRHIADHLTSLGHTVTHIIDRKRVYTHKRREKEPIPNSQLDNSRSSSRHNSGRGSYADRKAL